MNPEEVVASFCDELNKGVVGSLMYLSEDCIYQNMPFPAVRGPEEVKNVLEGFFAVVGPVRIETLRVAATGNFVMNERIDYFSPPNGKPFGLPVSGAFEIEHGKIVAWRDYFCMKQFSEGTGLDF
jgi:limonene-1,2-epoxide hydrolase